MEGAHVPKGWVYICFDIESDFATYARTNDEAEKIRKRLGCARRHGGGSSKYARALSS
jgi:hypothetical protein